MAKTSNGYNHTADTIKKAQTLRKGGWSYRNIADLLGVSHQMANYWCSPRYRQRRMKAQRRRRQVARMGALHRAGLDYENVAKVMTLDTGEPWTVGKVVYWLRRLK